MKKYKNVIDYYNNATDDYKYWSKEYNMHFGLAIFNVFNREKMLKKMNSYVLEKSGFYNKGKNNFIDLGCGCGATLRQGCKEERGKKITGVTLSDWQINKCQEICNKQKIENATVLNEDYHNLPFQDEQFDGGYALESICHSENREQVIKEASRVLKKGSEFVINDGFMKIDTSKGSKFFKKTYSAMCEGWAIPNFANIEEFKKTLERNNFKIKEIEDLSWKVAPTALHSPFVISKYLLFALLGKAPLQKQNLNNLKGSFM
ncbi:class I SAM-dependent methyltransferase [Flavobacteriales bacterium]|nr:class I SAM-dependent methyltransferase [Flavobacteriales bacterium]MDB4088633.1 class I SAM-dependent methyltransferase [Flavobacteriales bacterium]